MNETSMRDRLIELLDKAFIESDDNFGMPNVNQVADHLIANGVILLPCKVGDVVYQITRNFISEFSVRFIEISRCGCLFLHTDLVSGIILTGEIFPESDIGKTVFLTKEDAEKALKEKEKRNFIGLHLRMDIPYALEDFQSKN